MKLERRSQIVELITRQRTVTNAELMERFGVSIETARRDLDYLEQQGILRKVYGGAALNISLSAEPEYASRQAVKALESAGGKVVVANNIQTAQIR